MSCISLGIDVGNSDLKSSNTSTPSGYTEYQTVPFACDEYLKYNNIIYVPEKTRFPYTKDKTINDRAFILTLFGISKELLHIAQEADKRKRESAKKNPALASEVIGIQAEIDKYSDIRLGVGLPPTHCSTLSEPLKNYYTQNFKNGVSFTYKSGKNEYHFNLNLSQVKCYPQNYAALVTYKAPSPESYINKFKSYYAVDIGGYTVDVVTIINGKIESSLCDSIELGILKMYDAIIRQIEINSSCRLTHEVIFDVLTGEPTILDEQIIVQIFNMAEAWFAKIISQLRQMGIDFDAYPSFFMGGGTRLFQAYIESKKYVKHVEIIANPNANAEGYRRLIAQGK